MFILLDISLWENPIFYIALLFAGGLGALIVSFLPTQNNKKTVVEINETEHERKIVQLKQQNQSLYQQNQALQATISQQISHITKLENTLLQHDHTLIQALDNSKAEITHKQRIIERQSRDLLDSIVYARHIQTAMLPKVESIRNNFNDCFVLFRPRDIVSGDFYWFHSKNHRAIIAAVDCTGHGVPGAFLSMIGNDLLHKIVTFKGISEPDKILHQLHMEMRYTLRQKESGNEEGMDMAVCTIHQVPQYFQDLFGKPRIEFAGAKNSLVYIQHGEMKEIKGNKAPIGGYLYEEELEFTKHTIDISVPTTLYMFSDGYQDQFGGKNKRKFMVTRFRKLLLEIHEQPMSEQEKILTTSLEDWMGEGEHSQVDDILVMGIQIGQNNHTPSSETF
jgi:serine phosphatase RsbU (regulator of sigma subunit)